MSGFGHQVGGPLNGDKIQQIIAYLRSLAIFPEDFLAFLGSLRFTGEVRRVDA